MHKVIRYCYTSILSYYNWIFWYLWPPKWYWIRGRFCSLGALGGGGFPLVPLFVLAPPALLVVKLEGLVGGGIKEGTQWNRLLETQLRIVVDELVRAIDAVPVCVCVGKCVRECVCECMCVCV